MVAFLVYSRLFTPYTTRTILRDIVEIYFQLDSMICFMASLFFTFSLCTKTPIIHRLDPASSSCVSLRGGGLVWLDFFWSHPELPKIFPDSSSSTFFFSSSWSSPLGDRHHWETSPRKISCQFFKGFMGNNKKLAQDQSISKLLSAIFPQKNKKTPHFFHHFFSGENEHVILVEISNLQKIASNTSLSDPRSRHLSPCPWPEKKWLLQKNLQKTVRVETLKNMGNFDIKSNWLKSSCQKVCHIFLQGEINADQTIAILSSSELRVYRMKDRLHHFFWVWKLFMQFFSGKNMQELCLLVYFECVFYPETCQQKSNKKRGQLGVGFPQPPWWCDPDIFAAKISPLGGATIQ